MSRFSILGAALFLGVLSGCGKTDPAAQMSAQAAVPEVVKEPETKLKFKVELLPGKTGDDLRIYNLNEFDVTGIEVTVNGQYKTGNDFTRYVSPKHPFVHSVQTQFQGMQPGMFDVPLKVLVDDQGRSFGHKNYVGITKIAVVTPEGTWSGKLSPR